MKIAQKNLINELLINLEKSIISVKNLQKLPLEKLNYKKNTLSWSVLECLEHLNLYGNFYLPEIQKTIEKAIEKQTLQSQSIVNQTFNSGFFGEIFVDFIQVKNGKIKKMKAPKNKMPVNSGLDYQTIITFSAQLDTLRLLLEKTREKEIDMMKAKTPISITKLIKFSLGDTFRFVVFHIERHVLQAENTQI